ncbi:hypothetical protein, conserved [Eimeria acervulina]|uniref:CH-like domain-containing protein n=1 Tax=Eimeria acervulina TaxID=5801 RepID=U6GU27_EIMAC|nr:hypothetical protein, conserved [Eimeria acervulina]CDI83771.1 hypothetical protein, conserved [Eimeria acervulina]
MYSLPLSRPKRNLSRDFADGVLMAEVANHCIPQRVFKRVGLKLTAAEIDGVVAAKPGAAESIIRRFKQRAEALKQQSARDAEGTTKGTHLARCAPQAPPRPTSQQEWAALLAERDATIQELVDTNAILAAKADSLQKLLQLRDTKIELLTKALQAAAAPPPQ